MISICNLCRCFTQVIFQKLSMDIKFPIQIFLIFYMFVGCVVADNVTSIKTKSYQNPFTSCIISTKDVQKPLRARLFYRTPYNSTAISGCVNYNTTHRESKTTEKDTGPIKQRYLIHLAQKLPVRSVMRVALDIYASELYTQPLDISVVLHTVEAHKWILNMAHLASSVSSHQTSTLRIYLTHSESKLALEQLQLSGWQVVVKHVTPAVESQDLLPKWVEEHLFKQPLTMSAYFPYSPLNHQSTSLQLVNAIDFTVLSRNSVRTSSKVCDKKANLSRWITGFIDTDLNDGYTSCHTPNVWNADTKPSKKEIGGEVRRDLVGRTKLFQTVEFSEEFAKSEGEKKRTLKIQMRIQMKHSFGSRSSKNGTTPSTILAILSRSLATLQVHIDLRSFHGDIYIHTNIDDIYFIDSPRTRRWIVKEARSVRPNDQWLSRTVSRYDPNGGAISQWHVERVRFSRLPQIPLLVSSTTFIDISLSEQPILLRDLEGLVDLQCFNTEDLSISLDAKTFLKMGLQLKSVVLGKESCKFKETKDGRWVRKFVLHSNSPRKTCGTVKSDKGEMVTLNNEIYIISSVKDTTGLAPYPVAVRCEYGTQSTRDFPPIKKNEVVRDPVLREPIWGTWDGKGYYGPPPSSNRPPRDARIDLELYKDKGFDHEITYRYHKVRSGEKLYARLRPTDQTVDYGLMVRDCFLSNTENTNHQNGYPRQFLLIKGCDMGNSFRWQQADSYRVKEFSFELPRLSFFSMSNYIYLHCNAQPCNFNDKRPIKGLPRCWNQYALCDVPETHASTHLTSVPLSNADELTMTNAVPRGGDSDMSYNARKLESVVPLWGTVLIAIMAFFIGVVFTLVMWMLRFGVNVCTLFCGELEAQDRRDRTIQSVNSHVDYGKVSEQQQQKVTDRQISAFRPSCLHRLMPNTYMGSNGAGRQRDEASDEVVVKLLSGHNGSANCDSANGSGNRTKNSNSSSCSVCGEGSSSGIGTGNCSSCSAQACTLVNEKETLKEKSQQHHHLPPDSQRPAYLSYQQQQLSLPFSAHFASA